MNKIITLIALLGALGMIMGVSGCATPTGYGTLVLKITDAPAELNITQALVTISEVQVHKAGAENDTEDANETEMEEENEIGDSEEGWITVVNTSQTFDLTKIKDAKEFLGSANLTAGKYTQIRLSIERAIVTINGTEHDLKVPSKKLKLVRNFNIVDGQNTTLLLDFDAQKSVVETGNNSYILKPTIKVTQE